MVRTLTLRRHTAVGVAVMVALLTMAVGQSVVASTSVSLNVASDDPDGIARVLLGGAMAAFFGLDPNLSVGITARSSNGGVQVTPNAQVSVPVGSIRVVSKPADPFTDLPVWYISGYSDIEPARIIELRRKGRRWTEVAEYYRLPEDVRGHWVQVREPKKHGRSKEKWVFIPYTDIEFERVVRVRFIEEYYGVPRATINIWLDEGFTISDIFLTVNLAGRARVKPEQVIEYRRRGHGWEYITKRYGVPYAVLTEPVAPSRRSKYKVKHRDDDDD